TYAPASSRPPSSARTGDRDLRPLPLHDALPICSRSRRISARDSVPSTTIVLSTPLMIRTFFTILQPPILFTSFFVFCGALRRDKDRKSTRLNSSHVSTSYAVLCLKKTPTRRHGH